MEHGSEYIRFMLNGSRWPTRGGRICGICWLESLHQIWGSRRSTFGTQTRRANWFSIVVRHSSVHSKRNPLLHRKILALRLAKFGETLPYTCTSCCIWIVYVESGFPEIHAGKPQWSPCTLIMAWTAHWTCWKAISSSGRRGLGKLLIRRVRKVSFITSFWFEIDCLCEDIWRFLQKWDSIRLHPLTYMALGQKGHNATFLTRHYLYLRDTILTNHSQGNTVV